MKPHFAHLCKVGSSIRGVYKILKLLADRGVTVVLTADHGSILCQHAAKVSGDRPATNGLRFKVGGELICDQETGVENHPAREVHAA